jgi:glycosyltransferase involved in cell wall biosynthesis
VPRLAVIISHRMLLSGNDPTPSPRVRSGPPSRVALIHDWLTGMRGGEKVLEVLCELFPDARVFTLIHIQGSTSPTIERHSIETSLLQRLPGISRYYRYCVPLFPMMIEQFNLDECDLVISSSHCAAKAVIAAPRAVHICYCHTPMRYAWDQFDAYFGPARVGAALSRILRSVMAGLARWDRDTARRVTRFIANSDHVANRIRRYYQREATVVYPPIDTELFGFPHGIPPQRSALIVSALVPYKRIDVAIKACGIVGIPLRIIGDGPERDRLMRLAALSGIDTQFQGHVSDAAVRDAYRQSAVVLLPGEEDFGIVPLEAQASGRPVVALARGGALETIEHGKTGVLVEEGTPEAFASAIQMALDRSWDFPAIRRHAERFGRTRFAAQIQAVIDETWYAESH